MPNRSGTRDDNYFIFHKRKLLLLRQLQANHPHATGGAAAIFPDPL
jgi:hypothetical protein